LTEARSPSDRCLVVNPIKSWFYPLRIYIPYVIDVIMVSDPEHIKRIEASGDVDRLHKYATASLPWWVRRYFRATRFHDDERDSWFLAFEASSDASYARRRTYLEDKLSTGYTPGDVDRIARLLLARADRDIVAYEMVQVVNRRFFGGEIPLRVTKGARHLLRRVGQAILPWKYLRARRWRKQIADQCARSIAGDVHLVDVVHNISQIVQATARGLEILRDNLDKPVAEIFTSHHLTPDVPRIAVRSSKLDNLLLFPTRPAKTVVIFKIGKAAAKTRDLLFTFSTGRPERACVFQGFFLAFMRDLQQALRKMENLDH
jgi:hypothetical protein